MQIAVIKQSQRKNKKWAIKIDDKPVINIGDTRYQDFTQHKDPQRMKNYRKRHEHDPKSINTAGYWARELLWSKPTLKEAIKHIEKAKHIKIIKE